MLSQRGRGLRAVTGPHLIESGPIMAATLTSTPQRDGFWMPAEFEPHAGCWMLWPSVLTTGAAAHCRRNRHLPRRRLPSPGLSP